MRRIFSRADLWLLLVLILLAGLFWILRGHEPGQTLCVRVDGNAVTRMDLSRDGEYVVENAYGRNVIRISGGEAYVAEADCPNGDCLRGRISEAGESLACLPHHLTLVVEGEGSVDAVSGK